MSWIACTINNGQIPPPRVWHALSPILLDHLEPTTNSNNATASQQAQDDLISQMLLFGGLVDDKKEVSLISNNNNISTTSNNTSNDQNEQVHTQVNNLIIESKPRSSSRGANFGGEGITNGKWKNDTWIFDNITLRWNELETTGDIPSARGQHTLTPIPGEQRIVLFGGYDGLQYYNDVHSLDLKTKKWTKLDITGSLPRERGGHAMTAMTGALGTTLILFGGKNFETYFNDIYFLDLKTLKWIKALTSGDPPSARAHHTLTTIDKNVFIFGGEVWNKANSSGDTFNDIFVLNSTTMRWTKPTLDSISVIPPARFGHITIPYGKNLLVFGGACRKKGSLEQSVSYVESHLFSFNTETSKWRKHVPTSVISGAEAPQCYQHAAVSLYASKIFVFGGTKPELVINSKQGQAMSKTSTSDLFILYHLDRAVDPVKISDSSPTSSHRIARGLSKLSSRKPSFNEKKRSNSSRSLQQEAPAPLEVGLPYNFVRKLHVNFDYQWTGQDPTEVFELVEILGEGAYGTVYMGRHKETGFTIAIKEISMANGQYSEDLKKEIEILKKCRHSNVVSYFGTCKHEDKLWVLMDYCQLGSIRDLFETSDCTLDEQEIAFVCAQTLSGLVYLHAMNIIHRDVKAANILLTEEAQVKIADFGVSDTIGKANDSIGTPLWMAPEVIKGARYDSKCDIWSLGITTIEMADGIPPYAHLKIKRAMMMVPIKPPPTVASPAKWSRDFNDFVASCLIKDPDKRPSAADLLSHPFIQKARGPEALRAHIKKVQGIHRKRREENSKKKQQPDSDSSEDEQPRSPAPEREPEPEPEYLGTTVLKAEEDSGSDEDNMSTSVVHLKDFPSRTRTNSTADIRQKIYSTVLRTSVLNNVKEALSSHNTMDFGQRQRANSVLIDDHIGGFDSALTVASDVLQAKLSKLALIEEPVTDSEEIALIVERAVSEANQKLSNQIQQMKEDILAVINQQQQNSNNNNNNTKITTTPCTESDQELRSYITKHINGANRNTLERIVSLLKNSQ